MEQVVRPTGLLDPEISVRSSEGQIEDLYAEIQKRIRRKERTLVTTLTKKMAEQLAEYLGGMGVKCQWLHSELNAIERVELIQKLRSGTFDVLLASICCARPGYAEVSLVAILECGKDRLFALCDQLIQICRARCTQRCGAVIMYADRRSAAMEVCIRETQRRRSRQQAYNEQHGITPKTIQKSVEAILERHLEEKNRQRAREPSSTARKHQSVGRQTAQEANQKPGTRNARKGQNLDLKKRPCCAMKLRNSKVVNATNKNLSFWSGPCVQLLAIPLLPESS